MLHVVVLRAHEARHPSHDGKAHRPHAQIQGRDAQVHQGAAPGRRAVESPGDARGGRGPREPAHADGVEVAKVVAGDEVPEGDDLRTEAMRHAHGEDAIRRLGGLHHALRTLGRRRQRPLHQHVLARIQGLHGHLLVKVVGRADDHGVDLLQLQQVLSVQDEGHGVATGEGLGLVEIPIAEGGDLYVLAFDEDGEVHDLTDGAGTDDADADRIALTHYPFPPRAHSVRS